MVSRKTHQKSRKGCQNCKKRRIKCDEKKPSCSQCSRHSIVCDFSPNIASLAASQRTSPQQGATSINSIDGANTSNGSLRSPNLQDAEDALAGGLHVEELELLHHYATETCFTLSDRPESKAIWQKTVPKEAFSNQFLMRGILAISGLHLGSLRPEQQESYRLVAERHQNLALSLFRNAMESISRENCNAFFALSSLIVVYAFASLHPSQGIATAGIEFRSLESLSLIRGVNSILQTVWPWVLTGRLGGLIEDRLEARSCSELPDFLENRMDQLYALCHKAALDPDMEGALNHAIAELRSCYAKFYNKGPSRCEVSIAFIWPVVLQPAFIALLQAMKPEALVVLAFYCVVLHHLDGYWWMEGRGRYIFNTICQSLDKQWLEWVKWPADVFKSGERPLRAD